MRGRKYFPALSKKCSHERSNKNTSKLEWLIIFLFQGINGAAVKKKRKSHVRINKTGLNIKSKHYKCKTWLNHSCLICDSEFTWQGEQTCADMKIHWDERRELSWLFPHFHGTYLAASSPESECQITSIRRCISFFFFAWLLFEVYSSLVSDSGSIAGIFGTPLRRHSGQVYAAYLNFTSVHPLSPPPKHDIRLCSKQERV